MKNRLIIAYKIFFIGLLLQFILYNIFTWKVGLTAPRADYLRLRKEALLVFLIGRVGIILIQSPDNRKRVLFPDKTIVRFLLALFATIGITSRIHISIHQGELGVYLLAFKYDFLAFGILLIGVRSSGLLTPDQRREIILRYARVIKRCLLLALIWYLLIVIKPGALKLLGYDNFVFEGAVGAQPPAAYYTHLNQGITRNQFLFERPISWGFFLTAFWPLFFISFLYRQPVSRTWGRRLIYGTNILLTFSRAARGAWIIQIILIGVLFYRQHKSVFLFSILLPVLTLLGVVSILGYDQIFDRGYSNTGHLLMIQQGRELFIEQPVWGQGAATAGPASHRNGEGFNPENQFLQIMIEFGLAGFAGRFLLYAWLNIHGLIRRGQQPGQLYHGLLFLVAFNLGMIGLSASGMVLHSFADRMIVYPVMLLGGIIRRQAIEKESTAGKALQSS